MFVHKFRKNFENQGLLVSEETLGVRNQCFKRRFAFNKSLLDEIQGFTIWVYSHLNTVLYFLVLNYIFLVCLRDCREVAERCTIANVIITHSSMDYKKALTQLSVVGIFSLRLIFDFPLLLYLHYREYLVVLRENDTLKYIWPILRTTQFYYQF